mmetsp:Transcript_5743/g.15849  ORF Transcript_5743/g.15849 Transcript_5743/m.15849 type:complete len:317 (+) Transcript_5743:564-1514(+)
MTRGFASGWMLPPGPLRLASTPPCPSDGADAAAAASGGGRWPSGDPRGASTSATRPRKAAAGKAAVRERLLPSVLPGPGSLRQPGPMTLTVSFVGNMPKSRYSCATLSSRSNISDSNIHLALEGLDTPSVCGSNSQPEPIMTPAPPLPVCSFIARSPKFVSVNQELTDRLFLGSAARTGSSSWPRENLASRAAASAPNPSCALQASAGSRCRSAAVERPSRARSSARPPSPGNFGAGVRASRSCALRLPSPSAADTTNSPSAGGFAAIDASFAKRRFLATPTLARIPVSRSNSSINSLAMDPPNSMSPPVCAVTSM